ncbi:hypothetical protein COLO4_11432 [Corchorus olitorius]|uniref:Uncharacterized protein n=1 Tax=Corchorus olitorius TaxID=93759 RepID=A0A1R3K4K0_9ROSI|nr:hypothetical protein COLO4_11432 [Corchorus olitorius]
MGAAGLARKGGKIEGLKFTKITKTLSEPPNPPSTSHPISPQPYLRPPVTSQTSPFLRDYLSLFSYSCNKDPKEAKDPKRVVEVEKANASEPLEDLSSDKKDFSSSENKDLEEKPVVEAEEVLKDNKDRNKTGAMKTINDLISMFLSGLTFLATITISKGRRNTLVQYY